MKTIKIIPHTPKNESGLTQFIVMGESIRQIWVKPTSVPDIFHFDQL